MSSLLEITWTDPETDCRGYLVIDTLIRGLASGGLRLRAGCTIEEVRGLAQGMTRKEALVYDPHDHYIPLGGAKGGIDVDPADPRARSVLSRFVAAVLPVLREQWNAGEDFGLRQETLDEVVGELGLASTVEAVFATLEDSRQARERLAAAFAVDVDGISLGDLVGGYGVARAAVVTAERLGLGSATAVVQGFGSIGGAAARYLCAAGIRVVAVADRDGLMVQPDGLDVERLLEARDSSGVVDREQIGPDVLIQDRETWLDVPCDLLVPAAMSYVITAQDVHRLIRSGCRAVIEGANMPTLLEAEEELHREGIQVVPDFLANVMTNAWWWWVVFGDIAPDAASSFAKIDAVMRRLLDELGESTESESTIRQRALALAARNAAVAQSRVGITG